jgi:hypothetical protein
MEHPGRPMHLEGHHHQLDDMGRQCVRQGYRRVKN